MIINCLNLKKIDHKNHILSFINKNEFAVLNIQIYYDLQHRHRSVIQSIRTIH